MEHALSQGYPFAEHALSQGHPSVERASGKSVSFSHPIFNTPPNAMDQPSSLQVHTSTGQIWCGMHSVHSNHYEDRATSYAICSMNVKAQYDSSKFSVKTSQFDKPFTLECPSEMVVTSLQSVHSNYYEDRSFTMRCNYAQGLRAVPSSCSWKAWVNAYDGPLNFVCPSGTAIFAMAAQHSNHYEDRVFGFKFCAMTIYE